MNRKQIQLEYGHLPIDQLPRAVRRFVDADPELQTWFQEAAWLQGVLDLRRAEQAPQGAGGRIQHRVETRLALATPDELADIAAACAAETAPPGRGGRRWVSFLTGSDRGRDASPALVKFATPLTIVAGVAVGLYAVHLMQAAPATGGDPLLQPGHGLTTVGTGPQEGEGLFTNQVDRTPSPLPSLRTHPEREANSRGLVPAFHPSD